uniref:chemotaxis protein CheC n=1 Tax=Vagococcus salmoninarum TaxID=2739 RepID=UPI0028D61940
MSDNFTDLQLDVLKELINIGGAHGATSISQLIGKPVNMEVPLIEIMAYEELYQKLMAEDQQVYGVMS